MKKTLIAVAVIAIFLFVVAWVLYGAILPPQKGTFMFEKIRSYCESKSSSDIFGEPDDKGVVSRVGGAIDGAGFEKCIGRFKIGLEDLAP